MPKSYQHLIVRLRLEQSRILNWGEKVGVVETLLDQPSRILNLHRNLILDILLEVQAAIRSCMKTNGKYGPLLPSPSSALKQEKENRTFLQRTMKVLDKGPVLASKLQWAMVDHVKFSTLVNQLIGYNDSIETLLDRNTLGQIHVMQKQSHVAILQLTDKVDELAVLAQAFHLRAPHGEVRGISRSSTLVDDLSDASSTSARLAVFKAEQTTLNMKSFDGASFLIDSHEIDILNAGHLRPRAQYQNHAVWIEWKENDGRLGAHSNWNKIISERIQKLAILLASKSTPPEFHAPYCLGYFDASIGETDRFGLVYRVPEGDASSAGPISLRQCLDTGITTTLNGRIALAYAIAQSIMYLHAVSWLHKSIRSDNVLFFSGLRATKEDLNHPMLSGFGYARPDDPGAETEQHIRQLDQDLYRPPECQSMSYTRSRKSHDIYALGVVLVEIAYWKPIEAIIDIDLGKKGARKDIRNIQQTLTSGNEPFLQQMRDHIGETYASAVYRCLAGGLEIGIPQGSANEEDPIVGAEMYRVLSEEIVGKLGSIKV
jgi:Prion-inhibition and propagation/Protein kinase domain